MTTDRTTELRAVAFLQAENERLRAIVTRHTVVGGYPDTRAIAREAYELGLNTNTAASDRSPTGGNTEE